MGRSCPLIKKCFICERERHNKDFYANEKERTSLKKYCKHCKEIYQGIVSGLLELSSYNGLDFNTEQLQGDHYGFVIQLHENGLFTKITVEQAIRYVKQGAAYVSSSCCIQMFVSKVTDGVKLRDFILERDQHQCYYCGEEGDTVDHVIPQWNGGLDTPLNLVCSCKTCNSLKCNESKHTFLKKLKTNEFNKVSKKEKKHCKCCKEYLDNSLFDKQQIVCKRCFVYQPFIQLGILSPDSMIHFQNDIQLLKHPIIALHNLKNECIGFIKRKKAHELLTKGITTILDEKTIQFVLGKELILRFFPHYEYEHELLTEEEAQELAIPLKQVNRIAFFDQDNCSIGCGSIDRKAAVQLITLGWARIIKNNRIQLTTDVKKVESLYPLIFEWTSDKEEPSLSIKQN